MTVARPHSEEERPTADIVSDLNLPSTVRFCSASVAVQQYRFDAAERLTALVAERDTAQAEVGRLEAEKQFPLVRLGVGADRLDVALAQVAAVHTALDAAKWYSPGDNYVLIAVRALKDMG